MRPLLCGGRLAAGPERCNAEVNEVGRGKAWSKGFEAFGTASYVVL